MTSNKQAVLKGQVGEATVYVGDCRDVLRCLPARTVQCVVTSPPYWGLRRYSGPDAVWGGDPLCDHDWSDCGIKGGGAGRQGSTSQRIGRSNVEAQITRNNSQGNVCGRCGAWHGQLGNEPTPELFVQHLVECFRAVRRVLRDDGVVWLNLGDSYNAAGRTGHGTRIGCKQGTNRASATKSDWVRPSATGLKPKDLVGIPWMVAFALRADGWWLRQDIIWHKPNAMPESVTDRCTKAHEYLFLLTKSTDYYFDGFAIYEEGTGRGPGNKQHKHRDAAHAAVNNGDHLQRTKLGLTDIGGSETRNKRSVWTLSTHSYKGAHFATFPPNLVEPCVLAGTSEHGCCPACGTPWQRLVEKVRVPTRPAKDSKIAGVSADMVGNRDPLRHVTRKVHRGWQRACKCAEADAPVPCLVLDPFGGSGTVGMVASRHGRKSIIVEISREYGRLAMQRIKTGK